MESYFQKLNFNEMYPIKLLSHHPLKDQKFVWTELLEETESSGPET